MKRVVLLLSVIVLMLGATAASAHPEDGDPSQTPDCPCLSVGGVGTKSVAWTLPRAGTVYQVDQSLREDKSPLSGWVIQNRFGVIVAARIMVVDDLISSYSLREAESVKLPAGRYTITRLSRTEHRFEIPVRGIRPQSLTARAAPQVSADYSRSSLPATSELVATTVGPKARLLFVEARQLTSARLSLVSCVGGLGCANDTAEPPEDLPTYSLAASVTHVLGGSAAHHVALASGAGTDTSILRIVVSLR